jgi:hypothetical protein
MIDSFISINYGSQQQNVIHSPSCYLPIPCQLRLKPLRF